MNKRVIAEVRAERQARCQTPIQHASDAAAQARNHADVWRGKVADVTAKLRRKTTKLRASHSRMQKNECSCRSVPPLATRSREVLPP